MTFSKGSLSQDQLDGIGIAGRVSSGLSVLGVFTILGVFSSSRFFRSPTHRIIFYTAFYDLFEAIATMISVSGPSAGETSPLCQFQAFVLEMFPLADVLWTFAMALDAYLVVFHHFDAPSLKRLELKYVAVITVLTFIPAFTFLFIRTAAKGPIYGSSIIWCAITPSWSLVRLLVYFVPAWIAIVIITIVYGLIGVKIWVLHSDIRLTSDDYISPLATSSSSRPSERSGSTITNSTANTAVETSSQRPLTRVFEAQQMTIQTSLDRPPPTPLQPGVLSQRQISLRQYIVIPLLFFLSLLTAWVTPTIARVYLAIHGGEYVSYSLLLATSILGSLRGFWNAIIFVTMGIKGRRRRVSEGRPTARTRRGS